MRLPIRYLQMTRLILLMIRARPTHTRQDIKTDLPIRLWILNLLTAPRLHCASMITRLLMLQRPRRFASQHESFETGVCDAAVETEGRVEGRPHVAHLVQLAPDAGSAQLVFVVVEEDCGGRFVWVCGEGRPGGFGRKHSRAHRGVCAFDLGDVEEAGCVPYERAAGEGTFRDRLVAALVERAGAVGDALSSL